MKTSFHGIAGLILAGGQSRRFGSDKAFAEIRGMPMIAHVYRALAPCCTEVLVSVGSPATTYPLPGPARLVADRAPSAGPLSGLDAGLEATTEAWMCAVACDLPFVTATDLRALASERSDQTDAVVAVAPDGQAQPLCACYHRRVLPVVRDQLERREHAMRALLDRLLVRYVSLPAGVLRNVNTPGDFSSTRG